MYRVDDTCYRMSLQCHRCLHKSSEHYRIHRADIKAARAMRERVIERTDVRVRHVGLHATPREAPAEQSPSDGGRDPPSPQCAARLTIIVIVDRCWNTLGRHALATTAAETGLDVVSSR